jgi:hypothetical protein
VDLAMLARSGYLETIRVEETAEGLPASRNSSGRLLGEVTEKTCGDL